MKLTNCIWEKENLGKHVLEVLIEGKDIFDKEKMYEQIKSFDYVVVKVPMNMPDFNFGLCSMGFTMIETQLNISKRYNSFPFEDVLVKQIYPHTTLECISSQIDLDNLLDSVTSSMFCTDRVYLDSNFSKGDSSKRYKNWIRTEFEKKTSFISKIYYDDENVGFYMERALNNGTKLGLLGGIFEKYQDSGLGLMTASCLFIHANKKNEPFKVLRTAISSNNHPMMQFYNYLNFKINSMTYVFVKHNME